MFGFKKTSELDRLRAVYANQSDSELLRLHEGRDGLTDAGRQALDEAMEQRGLEDRAAEPAKSAAESGEEFDEWDRPGEVCGPDEVELYTFGGSQAEDLVRSLYKANIESRLTEGSYVRWAGLRSTREVGVTVIVKRSQENEAKECLNLLMTTPGFDSNQPRSPNFTPPSDLVLLLNCERADALDLVPSLSASGISFYWRDGRYDKEVAGKDVVAIEVNAAQLEDAERVMREWMNQATQS